MVKEPSKRLINSMYITYKEIATRRRVKIQDLLKDLHIGKTQLYEHLRYLETAGLVKKYRMDRASWVVTTYFVADKDEFEEIIKHALGKQDIYTIAFEIKEKIREYDIEADLFGTVKIHEEVPEHRRMTQDINIVVTKEHYKYLDLILRAERYSYGGKSELLYADHTYFVPSSRTYILVLLDGVKHPLNKQKRFYNLSPVLRTKKKIDLEHAVAGKFLMIPHMRRKTDAEDVADALAYGADVRKITDILTEVLSNYPEMEEVVATNIKIVEDYLRNYTTQDPYSIRKARYALRYIAENLADYSKNIGKLIKT